MATLDMKTPPGNPPSILLHSYTSERSPFSPSTTPRVRPEQQQQDDSSSSDKENSPTHIHRVNKGLLQMTSDSSTVSFTPRRVKPLPRAWERRPATPFVSRSEGQKIWKRMPLGELGFDANCGNISQNMSRREKEGKQDYIRAIKKLKVNGSGAQGFVSSEKTPSERVTGVSLQTTGGFVGTKWEEEEIEKGGSPKKKARSQRTDKEVMVTDGDATTDSYSHDDNASTLIATVTQTGNDDSDTSALVIEASGTSPVSSPGTSETNSKNVEARNAESAVVASDDTGDSEGVLVISRLQDDTRQPTPQTASANEADCEDNSPTAKIEDRVTDLDSERSNLSGDITEAGTGTVAIIASEPCSDISSSPDSGSRKDSEPSANGEQEAVQSGRVMSDLVESDQTSLQLNLAPQSSCEDQSRSIEEVDRKNYDFDTTISQCESSSAIKDAGSLEPCENSELISAGKITNSILGAENDVSDGQSVQSEEAPASIKSVTTFVGTDEEDTAFLHDFILRAKASKAAREAVSPQEMEAGTIRNTSETALVPDLSHNPLIADDIEDPEEDLPHSLQIARTEEAGSITEKSLSPVRRSSRNSSRPNNTRLPRPQNLPPVPQFGPVLLSQGVSLPNTIQLKRATGSEFVFTARAQQTTAMATRSNTKRNQGGAVNVIQRLAQIKSEQHSDGTTDSPMEFGSPNGKEIFVSVDVQSPAKNKKRKRVEDDNHEKTKKKNVKWNEELASYREISTSPIIKPTSDDFAAIEAAAQAEALNETTDDPTTSTALSENATGKVNATTVIDKQSSDKENTQPASDSRVKVRRIRETSVGNVNGTPAPKTRSQSSRLAVASSSVSSVGTRSRMPVPISTPIPIPSLLKKASATTDKKQGDSNKDKKKGNETEKKGEGSKRGVHKARS